LKRGFFKSLLDDGLGSRSIRRDGLVGLIRYIEDQLSVFGDQLQVVWPYGQRLPAMKWLS